MRELNTQEMQFVTGGDDVDGNLVGCQTAIGAGVVISGLIGGTTTGTTAGVLSYAATEVCQSTTTYVGDAIGTAAANVAIGYEETSNELSYSLDSLYMAMKWLTLGL